MALARELAAGPTFANGITKTMLHQEWAMTIEQAIEAEAQAQAICMLTEDFTRAYEAFAAKQKPRSRATEMLKLHGFAQSGNTFKVAFLLRALGVPWQPVAMSFAAFAAGATRDPAWREGVNAMGEVPVLELDDGRKITQSGVILTMLAEQHGRFGGNGRRRAARDPALALLRQPQVHQLLRDLALHEGVRRQARPTRRSPPS